MRSHAKATSAIAAIGCAIFLACICASPALAAKGVVGFVGGAGVEGGQFATTANGPGDVAVNLNGSGGATAGDVYVVDRGNNRIQQFHADGTWVRAFGLNVGGTGINVCEVKASCIKSVNSADAGAMTTPQGLAIEQASGLLYVSDRGNRRVDVFSAIGAFQGAFGREVDASTPAEELQLCTTSCQSGTEGSPGSGAAGAFSFNGLAYLSINPSNGNLLVADVNNHRVNEFAPTLTGGVISGVSFVHAYGWGVATGAAQFEVCTTTCQAGLVGEESGEFGPVAPGSVVADSSGRTYAIDTFNSRVQAFSSVPAPEGAFAPSLLSGSAATPPFPTDLAVDPSTNYLLVLKPCAGLSCGVEGEYRLLELDSAGNLIEAQAAKAGITTAPGLGLGAAGRSYVTTRTSGPDGKPGFFIFDTLVPPAVTIEPVTTFTGTTASFEGHVTTDTVGARYHFEYSENGTSWTRLPAEAPGDPTLPGDSAQHAVSQEVTGLEAHTEYQVRLVADKEFAGGSASAETSFTTAASAPIILSASHSHKRDTSVLLHGTVNPENEETEYSFQYATKASFEAEGFNGAASVPAPPGQLSGGHAVEFTEQLSGLSPESAYVYRLLASNQSGDVESAVGSFTTYATPQHFGACANDQFRTNRPSEILPDCRAYEQASPVDKNGGNVQSEYYLTRASASGDRISFNVVVPIPGAEGTQDFPTYLSSRKGGNWSTQGVLPAAAAADRAKILGWTPDFDSVFSWGLKLGAGTGLFSRSSEGGALSTISPYGAELGAAQPSITYLGSSADNSIAFFNAAALLPVATDSAEPAPGEDNLYAWNRGTGQLHLAGVLPDGSVPTKGVTAGIKNGYRIDTHVVAADGSVYFTDQRTGQLYHRFNPTAPETTDRDIHGDCIPDPTDACTVHVSVSEKDDGGGFEGHDAAGSAPTRFMAASTDGSKAIFTSSEKLTNDSYTGVETTEPPAIARATDNTDKDLTWLPASAGEIAIAGEYVYWVEGSGEGIGRAKLDKSLFEEGFITGLSNVKDVAVVDQSGAEYVFWSSSGPGEAEEEAIEPAEPEIIGEGAIGRANLDGEDVRPDCLEDIENPRGIAANAEHVYWTSPGRIRSEINGGAGKAFKADLSCSSASIDTDLIEGFNSSSGDIAVDADHLYVSAYIRGFEGNVNSSFIYQFELDGSGPVFHDGFSIELQGVGSAASLALDGSHLYWTNPGTSEIGRSELDGSSPQFNFITNAGHPKGLAVDSGHVYWSANQEVPPNTGNDLYSYDSEAPEHHRLTDLAPENDGEDGIEVQGVLGASADASYVYFVANGVPDGGVSNSPNANDEEAEAGDCEGVGFNAQGSCNLYLAHDGEVTFIARLNANRSAALPEANGDASNWVATEEELDQAVVEKTARVSPDGETLLFRSRQELTGYDNEGPVCAGDAGDNGKPIPGICPQFFRYRVGEGLTCVSCNPTGALPLGPPNLGKITTGFLSAPSPAPVLVRNLSVDGNRVFFETPDALVPGDTNGDEGCPEDNAYSFAAPACQDAYEWEAAGAGSCPPSAGQQGCIYLLSTGKSPQPSFLGDAGESGNDAFIYTYSKLVRQDEDDQLDVYDVSVGGGLTSQDALSPVPCEGEACKGGAAPVPQSPSAGSESFSGSANPKPTHKKKAKKRKHARKHRHAKRHHAKKHHHRAKTNGRASR